MNKINPTSKEEMRNKAKKEWEEWKLKLNKAKKEVKPLRETKEGK